MQEILGQGIWHQMSDLTKHTGNRIQKTKLEKCYMQSKSNMTKLCFMGDASYLNVNVKLATSFRKTKGQYFAKKHSLNLRDTLL